MIRFLTAGESHGKALISVIDGFPANFELSKEYIDNQLKRRQSGYGRGLRMKIESDEVEIISGVRYGKTLGSPISLMIRNRDWENWKDRMDSKSSSKPAEKITIPRPGHADLVGLIKYGYSDIRNSIERSSARETAARVAAGSIARKFLEYFNITVGSFVESIGGIYSSKDFKQKLFEDNFLKKYSASKISLMADRSEVRVLDNIQEEKIIRKIKQAKKKGDTLGGTFFVFATGVPAGLGSFMQYDQRLDSEIAASIISINAVKGVEVGDAFNIADSFGSESHDEIIFKYNAFTRRTNRAGGIEGGISTGLPIIVKAAMKPIATLMTPIQSVDLKNFKSVDARRERSDFVAVPACSVIAESMFAWSLAKFFLLKFGGDSLDETRDNYKNYAKKIIQGIKRRLK
ncbi:MAG: chorismate synthase [Ignavibacteriaceae bacterium]|nr:chorismate synthase [Ignavibacteriaceae bacterium]